MGKLLDDFIHEACCYSQCMYTKGETVHKGHGSLCTSFLGSLFGIF